MQAAVEFRHDVVNGVIGSAVSGTVVSLIAAFEGRDCQRRPLRASRAITRTVGDLRAGDPGAGISCHLHVPGLMMSRRPRLDLWVGLFVAIGFAAALVFPPKVGNFSGLDDGAETHRVEALLTTSAGLAARAGQEPGVLVGWVGDPLDPAIYRAVVEPRSTSAMRFLPTPPRPSSPPSAWREQYVG